jgi:protein-S-isoprenylcysteine O-methyltransferase Ste14
MDSVSLLKLAITLLGLGIFAMYSRTVRTHFASPKIPKRARSILLGVPATVFIFIVLTWMNEAASGVRIAALVLQAFAGILYIFTMRATREARLRLAFDETGPSSLVQKGPYRFVRHPFYFSYAIFWSGWALGSGSPWSLIPLAFLIMVYVTAAREEEKMFASSRWAEQYAEYKRQAGFFWPVFK